MTTVALCGVVATAGAAEPTPATEPAPSAAASIVVDAPRESLESIAPDTPEAPQAEAKMPEDKVEAAPSEAAVVAEAAPKAAVAETRAEPVPAQPTPDASAAKDDPAPEPAGEVKPKPQEDEPSAEADADDQPAATAKPQVEVEVEVEVEEPLTTEGPEAPVLALEAAPREDAADTAEAPSDPSAEVTPMASTGTPPEGSTAQGPVLKPGAATSPVQSASREEEATDRPAAGNAPVGAATSEGDDPQEEARDAAVTAAVQRLVAKVRADATSAAKAVEEFLDELAGLIGEDEPAEEEEAHAGEAAETGAEGVATGPDQLNRAVAAATARNVNRTTQRVWQLQIGCIDFCFNTSQTQSATQTTTTAQDAVADAAVVQRAPSNALAGSGTASARQANEAIARAAATNVDETVQTIKQVQIGCQAHCRSTALSQSAANARTATQTADTLARARQTKPTNSDGRDGGSATQTSGGRTVARSTNLSDTRQGITQVSSGCRGTCAASRPAPKPGTGHGPSKPSKPGTGHGPSRPGTGHGPSKPSNPVRGQGPSRPGRGHGSPKPSKPGTGHGSPKPSTPSTGHGAPKPSKPGTGGSKPGTGHHTPPRPTTPTRQDATVEQRNTSSQAALSDATTTQIRPRNAGGPGAQRNAQTGVARASNRNATRQSSEQVDGCAGACRAAKRGSGTAQPARTPAATTTAPATQASTPVAATLPPAPADRAPLRQANTAKAVARATNRATTRQFSWQIQFGCLAYCWDTTLTQTATNTAVTRQGAGADALTRQVRPSNVAVGTTTGAGDQSNAATAIAASGNVNRTRQELSQVQFATCLIFCRGTIQTQSGSQVAEQDQLAAAIATTRQRGPVNESGAATAAE